MSTSLNLTRGAKIAEGTHGCVYRTNNPNILCKTSKMDKNTGLPETFLREISAINMMDNEHIIKLYGVHWDQSEIHYYMPKYVSDLNTYIHKIHKTGKIQFAVIKKIMYQILCAYYHSSSLLISHRDIKPHNILIDDKDNIVLCDWGLSRFMGNDQQNFFTVPVQTLWYRAPELLLGQKKYDYQIDMWSIGAIFYELYKCEHAFAGDSEIGQLIEIFQLTGTPTCENWREIDKLDNYIARFPQFKTSLKKKLNNMDSTCYDLLSKMLHLDPSKRIDVVDALNHKFFDDVRLCKYIQPSIVTNLNKRITVTSQQNYLLFQPNIKQRHIEKLLGWLLDVCNDQVFSHETFFLACHYLSTYLIKSVAHEKNIQLIGICCLMLASKITEKYGLDTISCQSFCAGIYSLDQINDMERYIFEFICQYQLYHPTEYTYLSILSGHLNVSDNVYYKSLALLYISLFNSESKTYNSYNMAVTAINCYTSSSNVSVKTAGHFKQLLSMNFNNSLLELLNTLLYHNRPGAKKYISLSLSRVDKDIEMIKKNVLKKLNNQM